MFHSTANMFHSTANMFYCGDRFVFGVVSILSYLFDIPFVVNVFLRFRYLPNCFFG